HVASRARTAAAGAVTLGTAAALYSVVEARRPHLSEVRVPITRGPDVTVLQVADTHLTGRHRHLGAWLARLPQQLGETPDIIVGTGDFIEEDAGIDRFLDAIAELSATVGKFYVFGSHDYYQSRFKPVSRYFSGRHEMPTVRADTVRLERGLEELGWVSLLNRDVVMPVGGHDVRLSGVDDPYLNRHRTDHVKRASADELTIGIMHTPDLVSDWALHGYDLVLSGHTHGGQIRLPIAGALVTNCSLPASLAMGLHHVGRTWLHVSPGLGTSRYAPIRFLARPEATLLRLSTLQAN
ncbi:MAG: metallophosphoesterase, partial [Actinomycetota bacterium]|nr:metallophosphoesterase [Actinomycetota bacterium]